MQPCKSPPRPRQAAEWAVRHRRARRRRRCCCARLSGPARRRPPPPRRPGCAASSGDPAGARRAAGQRHRRYARQEVCEGVLWISNLHSTTQNEAVERRFRARSGWARLHPRPLAPHHRRPRPNAPHPHPAPHRSTEGARKKPPIYKVSLFGSWQLNPWKAAASRGSCNGPQYISSTSCASLTEKCTQSTGSKSNMHHPPSNP
jgi:hypothetical protein